MFQSPYQYPEVETAIHEERLETVVEHLLESGAKSVLDLGCGGGGLVSRLAEVSSFEKITGIDISSIALSRAQNAIEALSGFDHSTGAKSGRISFLHASFLEPDERLKGYDAAALVETIEHIPPNQLSALEHAVFACYRPRTVIITTPNIEYNVLYNIPKTRLRHPEHFFEWTRAKFKNWTDGVASRNRYTVALTDIGPFDLNHGSPTQMATFSTDSTKSSSIESV